MRNAFDQYSGWENRLTHSLMTSLNEDHKLLRSFLRDVAKWRPEHGRGLEVLEQRLPGEKAEGTNDERKGLPDGWIHDGESWALLIESKIGSPLTTDQLNRHLRTARRRGFDDVLLLAIVAVDREVALPADAALVTWRQIYSWLQRHVQRSRWATITSEYMTIVERKMMEEGSEFEGSLTEFTGFCFGPSHPYSYGEGKRVIRLAMEELRLDRRLVDELGIDPKLAGRKAITRGRHDHVWDFLQLGEARGAEKVTHFPHFTLGLQHDRVEAHLVIPNAMKGARKSRLTKLEPEEFADLLCTVEKDMRPIVRRFGALPFGRSLHRHFRGQRVSMIDAELMFDLRTLAGVSDRGDVKPCDAWVQAARAGLSESGINYEFHVGMRLEQKEKGPLWKTETALDFVVGAFAACKPVVDLLREKR